MWAEGFQEFQKKALIKRKERGKKVPEKFTNKEENQRKKRVPKKAPVKNEKRRVEGKPTTVEPCHLDSKGENYHFLPKSN